MQFSDILHIHIKQCVYKFLRIEFLEILNGLPHTDVFYRNLIVLDGTTGQNALVQAREFGEVADLTGIILTKMDGTAKGGIVIAIAQELQTPVKFVGVGEGADDLRPFDAREFLQELF